MHRSHCAPLTPAQVKHRFVPQTGEGELGRGGQGPACQTPPQGKASTSHLPRPSHSLLPALMDIKNRTRQGWRWEQNPCTTGLDRCSHSAVKCKNKKGQPSCLPQDASRFFFNTLVPPHISLRMLHYIYVSLKYLPFFLSSCWVLRELVPSPGAVGWCAVCAVAAQGLHLPATFSFCSLSWDSSHSFSCCPPP